MLTGLFFYSYRPGQWLHKTDQIFQDARVTPFFCEPAASASVRTYFVTQKKRAHIVPSLSFAKQCAKGFFAATFGWHDGHRSTLSGKVRVQKYGADCV